MFDYGSVNPIIIQLTEKRCHVTMTFPAGDWLSLTGFNHLQRSDLARQASQITGSCRMVTFVTYGVWNEFEAYPKLEIYECGFVWWFCH